MIGGRASTPLSALEPFSFLITTSPRFWASSYHSMSDWLCKAVNNLLVPSQEPFKLSENASKFISSASPSTHQSWLALENQLNGSVPIEDLWTKFTVVDKVLTMFGEENWNEKNMAFFGLQHHVWWVVQANSWFSLIRVRTSQEYIQTAMSALLMELIYRFVWARYTQKIFMKRAPALTSNETIMQLDNDDSDEILEGSDLGDASESGESENMSESSFADYDTEQNIIKKDNMGKLKDFFAGPSDLNAEDEEGEAIENSDGEEDEEEDNIGKPKRFNIESETGYAATTDSSCSESQEDGNKWLDEIPGSTPLFFHHPRIAEALESIEKQYWIDERFDIREALAVVLNLCLDRNVDLQLPKQAPSFLVTQMTYAYEKVFTPFLTSMGISIDTLEEGSNFKSTPFDHLKVLWTFNTEYGDYWVDNILKCTFANLSSNGSVPAIHFVGIFPKLLLNSDARTDSLVSTVYDTLHTKAISKGTITPHVEALVKTLDSLTAEKGVLQRQNLKQFTTPLASRKDFRPNLLGDDSSKGVGTDEKNGNSNFGFFGASTDSNGDANGVDGENGAMEEDDELNDADADAVPKNLDPNSMEGRLYEHRRQRIKQIDAMMAEIKTEFNRVTGHIDSVASRRRPGRKTKDEVAMEAVTQTPQASNAINGVSSELFKSEEELFSLGPIS